MAGNKPGPKPKGDRVPITARIPRDHHPRYEQQASDAGLPLCDYVALVMARAHGLPEPEYLSRTRKQEALPLGA